MLGKKKKKSESALESEFSVTIYVACLSNYHRLRQSRQIKKRIGPFTTFSYIQFQDLNKYWYNISLYSILGEMVLNKTSKNY